MSRYSPSTSSPRLPSQPPFPNQPVPLVSASHLVDGSVTEDGLHYTLHFTCIHASTCISSVQKPLREDKGKSRSLVTLQLEDGSCHISLALGRAKGRVGHAWGRRRVDNRGERWYCDLRAAIMGAWWGLAVGGGGSWTWVGGGVYCCCWHLLGNLDGVGSAACTHHVCGQVL